MINRAHNFQIQSVRIPLTFYSTTKSCPTFRSTPKACPTFLSIPTRGGSRISSKEGRGALKKLRRAEGGAKIVEVFHVKNHDFTPKKSFFFSILGGRAPGAPPCLRLYCIYIYMYMPCPNLELACVNKEEYCTVLRIHRLFKEP